MSSTFFFNTVILLLRVKDSFLLDSKAALMSVALLCTLCFSAIITAMCFLPSSSSNMIASLLLTAVVSSSCKPCNLVCNSDFTFSFSSPIVFAWFCSVVTWDNALASAFSKSLSWFRRVVVRSSCSFLKVSPCLALLSLSSVSVASSVFAAVSLLVRSAAAVSVPLFSATIKAKVFFPPSNSFVSVTFSACSVVSSARSACNRVFCPAVSTLTCSNDAAVDCWAASVSLSCFCSSSIDASALTRVDRSWDNSSCRVVSCSLASRSCSAICASMFFWVFGVSWFKMSLVLLWCWPALAADRGIVIPPSDASMSICSITVLVGVASICCWAVSAFFKAFSSLVRAAARSALIASNLLFKSLLDSSRSRRFDSWAVSFSLIDFKLANCISCICFFSSPTVFSWCWVSFVCSLALWPHVLKDTTAIRKRNGR